MKICFVTIVILFVYDFFFFGICEQILELDNDIQLIRWLDTNTNFSILKLVDHRLGISLFYRITQMLKNQEYVGPVCDFLEKEFMSFEDTKFNLPDLLKKEFHSALLQCENEFPNVGKILHMI